MICKLSCPGQHHRNYLLVMHIHACKICSKNLFHQEYVERVPGMLDEYGVAQRKSVGLHQASAGHGPGTTQTH